MSRLLSVALAALGERWRREAYRFVGIGANMKLAVNLLVLRCKDIEVTRRFYEQLGLSFVEEKHGTRPQHYAWESGGFVLELYPAAEGGRHPIMSELVSRHRSLPTCPAIFGIVRT